MSGRVRMTLDGDVALLRAIVPGERYDEYRTASDGANYDKSRRAVVATFDKVGTILQRLRVGGFSVNLEPALEQAVSDWDIQQWQEFQATKTRIEVIDGLIKKQTVGLPGYPEGQTLRPYQRTAAMWLAFRRCALLADDMGLGKTRSLIVALPANSPVIVVCPNKVKYEWKHELVMCRPPSAGGPKAFVLEGSKSFRWPEPNEIVITSYHILPEIHDREGKWGRRCKGLLPEQPCKGCLLRNFDDGRNIMARISPGEHKAECKGKLPPIACPGCVPLLKQAAEGTVLIPDEAQYVKSKNARMTKRMRAVANAVHDKNGRIWLSTGTPMENSPEDMWSLLTTAHLAEEAFGDRKKLLELFKATAKFAGEQHPRFVGYDWGEPDTSEIKERLRRVSLRRMKTEVMLDLPNKTVKDVVVPIDTETLRQCDVFLRESGDDFEKILGLIEKGQQKIEFAMMSAISRALAIAKIDTMLEYVKDFEDAKEPLVVFSAHRQPIEALMRRPGWGYIMGEQKAAEAFAMKTAFQAGKLKGIGITIKAGGTGLNLTRACHMMFVDELWNPMANLQAQDRIWRMGQRLGVVIYRLIANHKLDIRRAEVLARKQNIITKSVDAARVTDDAPTEVDFQQQYDELRREIRECRAPRREAVSDVEKKALEDLHRAGVVYPTRSDARLARDFAEQGVAVGLSDAQWKLVIEVVARGILPEPEQPVVNDDEEFKEEEVDDADEIKEDSGDEEDAGSEVPEGDVRVPLAESGSRLSEG